MRRIGPSTVQLDKDEWKEWQQVDQVQPVGGYVRYYYDERARLFAKWGIAYGTQLLPPDGGHYYEGRELCYCEPLKE